MVVFRLTKKENNKLYYIYYPMGIEKEGGGIIEIDTEQQSGKIIAVAPLDNVREISVKEQKMMRDIVATLREEGGHPKLTEEEWPIPVEVLTEVRYGDAAMKKIIDSIKSGEIPNMGMAKC
ncbi:hypothetical protein [Howardella ureilytica]|nr:hypothetical protein [Lachnospiraceae bacterium]